MSAEDLVEKCKTRSPFAKMEIHVTARMGEGIHDLGEMPLDLGVMGLRSINAKVHRIFIHPDKWREIEIELRKMKSATGEYLWQPGINDSKLSSVFGVEIIDHRPL